MTIIQTPSQLFTAGRACAGPLAIVLHGYSAGLEMLDGDMGRCPRPRPAQSPGCHSSFHYGVGGSLVHQYVANANTAWGFGVTPPSCPAPVCPPDPCESCTGITVDQYNPDLDGNPPVLPAWAAGPDGTVNCAVLHVAITGAGVDGQGCCRFLADPQAYQAVVNSLCEIFATTELVPSQNTLLVHCGELPCLDIDQLVLDIIECLDAPEPVLPPCQCTPVIVEDTPNLLSVVDSQLLVNPNYAINEIEDTDVIEPNEFNQLYLFVGAAPATVDLDPPASTDVANTVIIKNRGTAALTVTASAGSIDGVASITLAPQSAGAFPFGSNGGESVTLVWNGTLWIIV